MQTLSDVIQSRHPLLHQVGGQLTITILTSSTLTKIEDTEDGEEEEVEELRMRRGKGDGDALGQTPKHSKTFT